MRRRAAPPPYRLLSLLFDYPSERIDAAVAPAVAAVPESFRLFWRQTPLAERQRLYVETFDLDRRTSLHLSWYLYGDTRKRGMALLRLKRQYAAAGLELGSGELPDHLAVLLEFAAGAPAGYGHTLLIEHRLGLELLRLRLTAGASPWAALAGLLCASLPRLTAPDRDRVARLLADGPPGERVGLEPFAPPEVMPVGAGR